MTAPRLCIAPTCSRAAYRIGDQQFAHCHSHLDALVERIFGGPRRVAA